MCIVFLLGTAGCACCLVKKCQGCPETRNTDTSLSSLSSTPLPPPPPTKLFPFVEIESRWASLAYMYTVLLSSRRMGIPCQFEVSAKKHSNYLIKTTLSRLSDTLCSLQHLCSWWDLQLCPLRDLRSVVTPATDTDLGPWPLLAVPGV